MKHGRLEHKSKYYPLVTPGGIVQPGDVSWAASYYENFWSGVVARGAGHFYMEDQNAAQDFGLWMVESVL